jgi:membrane-associated HD superfamily phosphohydrolase
MYNGLLHAHSGLRWIALLLLIITIVDSLVRMYRPFKENEKKLALFTLISLHTQLLIGVILYFVSPRISDYIEKGDIMKNADSRFFMVEHFALMLLAIILVTVGYSRAKRQSEHWTKHRMIFFYYLTAFILIMISIPWPFREIAAGRGWF